MRMGAVYYIQYKLSGHKKLRHATLRFISESDDVYFFDGRPEFGTCHLPKSAVSLIEERMPTAKLYAGRIVK